MREHGDGGDRLLRKPESARGRDGADCPRAGAGHPKVRRILPISCASDADLRPCLLRDSSCDSSPQLDAALRIELDG